MALRLGKHTKRGAIGIGAKILSIEIGLQETKVCEISQTPGIRKVFHCVTFPTPANTVEDGYIRDKVTYSNELKNVIKNEKFTADKAIFTIASTKIYTKEIIIPQVSNAKIRGIIETNITEYLPFSTADYVINYSIIERIKENKQKKIRVLLIAMPENMVKNYYSTAAMAGLEVESLDYNGNSIYQVLKRIPEKGTNVYIQMNEQSTMVSILRDRAFVLQRTIAYGTNEMVQAVIERNCHMNLNEKKAYELLVKENFITRDFSAYSEVAVVDSTNSEHAIDAIRTAEAVSDTVSYLVSSLGRVVDYYINQGGTAIQKVYLIGHGARIKGMQEFIQRELGIYPEMLNDLNGYKAGKTAIAYKENPSEFIGCLGAVVAPVGFQPKEVVAKKAKRSNVIETGVIVSICLVGSLILYGTSKSDYRTAKRELEDAYETLSGLPTQEAVQGNFDELIDQLSQIEALNNVTKTNVEKIYELMGVFEENMVTLTDVKSMQVTDEAVSMKVTLPSKEAAAKLILQLESLTDYFRQIQISGLSETKDKNGISEVSFSLSCMFHVNQSNEGESEQ